MAYLRKWWSIARTRKHEWAAVITTLVIFLCAYAPPWRHEGDYFHTIHEVIWSGEVDAVVPLTLIATMLLLLAVGSDNGRRRKAAFAACVVLAGTGAMFLALKVPLGGAMLLIVSWRSAQIYLDEPHKKASHVSRP